MYKVNIKSLLIWHTKKQVVERNLEYMIKDKKICIDALEIKIIITG